MLTTNSTPEEIDTYILEKLQEIEDYHSMLVIKHYFSWVDRDTTYNCPSCSNTLICTVCNT